jgi:hypothetical protein
MLLDTQKFVRNTSKKLLMQFHPNFTGMSSTKSSCAYYQILWFSEFCPIYGPLIIFIF